MSHTLPEAVILLSDAFQAKRCSSHRYGRKLILFYFIILQQVDLTSCACAASLQSCPILCDPWTVARQAPRSVGFSRQEYWSGLPFPSPADLPHPRLNPGLLHRMQILYTWATRESPTQLLNGKIHVELLNGA